MNKYRITGTILCQGTRGDDVITATYNVDRTVQANTRKDAQIAVETDYLETTQRIMLDGMTARIVSASLNIEPKQEKPAQSEHRWQDNMLYSMQLRQMFHVDVTDAEHPEDAPYAFLTYGPHAVIEDFHKDENGIAYGDCLGHIIYTAEGPVVQFEDWICRGTIANDDACTYIYGPIDTLTALDAQDITPLT